MATPWSEVEQSEEYQGLTNRQKQEAREQYFTEVVAPQVPKSDIASAREQFYTETKAPTAEGTRPGSYAARAMEKTKAVDPTKDMSRGEKFLAGVGKAFHDIGIGAEQRAGDIFELAGAKRPEWAPTGEDVSRQRELEAPLMKTRAGRYGDIAGGVAATLPLARIPGAATIRSGAGAGAGMGVLQPTTQDESVLENALIGGAFGGGVPAALRGISKVINPTAVKERISQALGTPTLGQALGGFFKTAEEKATSLPIAGHFIAQAHKRAVEGFNEGVLNKALEPIGQKVSKIGHEGVQEANQKLSQAYNDILPKLNITVDDAFDAEMKNLRQMSQSLAPAQREQFERILGTEGLGRKITSAGKMSGVSMKEMDSQLAKLARGYTKSEDFDKQQLGYALQEAQASLRSMVQRQNPNYAEQLANINSGWARMVRVQNAASRVGAKDGVFTPSQLLSAVRSTDQSFRHKQFAEGSALFQDVASKAEKVIGGKYPDTGTAGRVLFGGLGAGAEYAAAPQLLGLEAALTGAYTPTGQRFLTALASKRPGFAPGLAEAVRGAEPTGARAGVAAGEAYESVPEQKQPEEEEQ